jgi:hypothetical protein
MPAQGPPAVGMTVREEIDAHTEEHPQMARYSGGP